MTQKLRLRYGYCTAHTATIVDYRLIYIGLFQNALLKRRISRYDNNIQGNEYALNIICRLYRYFVSSSDCG